MKKNKARLREKIRNQPKSRNTSKRKKRAGAQATSTEEFQRPHPQSADQSMEVMSQVILDFAAPLLETCSDEASERKAISLAIYVWNTAMLPEPQCRRTLEAYLTECQNVMPPEALNTLSDFIDQLVQTRRTRFAHNRKKITNCTFGDHGPDRHIEVGYTME
jgi:ketopantoate reductase